MFCALCQNYPHCFETLLIKMVFCICDPSHQNRPVVSKNKIKIQKFASSTVHLLSFKMTSYSLNLGKQKERFEFFMFFFIICCLLVLSPDEASRQLVGFDVTSHILLSITQDLLSPLKF